MKAAGTTRVAILSIAQPWSRHRWCACPAPHRRDHALSHAETLCGSRNPACQARASHLGYSHRSSTRTQPFPLKQTVYISNHTSTLDLFILVALGLPNTRFFLSGFLRKYVPLGFIAYLMGTFFTVPQDRPAERTRIFQRADRILRRTRESVYLSPEGGRITTGEIGQFNKGAFHLATSLKAPIVPMYFHIPSVIDPGMGFNARSRFGACLRETGNQHRALAAGRATTRTRNAFANLFVEWHQEIRGINHGEPSHGSVVLPAALEAR